MEIRGGELLPHVRGFGADKGRDIQDWPFLMTWKMFIRRRPSLHHCLTAARAHARNPLCRLKGRPLACIPWKLRAEFSMYGRVQILYRYSDGSQSRPIVYDRHTIDAVCYRVATGELGHYKGIDAWLHAALKKYPIRGQQVAIMGSADQGFGPWYECLCLYYRGNPTTIDYNPIDFQDSRLHFVKAPINLVSLKPFDAAFSISSFEHDGLGRYGDPLDPAADLNAMHQMKQLIKRAVSYSSPYR